MADRDAEGPTPTSSEDRSILILYGTETGNSEEIAGELGKMAERLHFDTVVGAMNDFSLKDILLFSLVVFVTSTTGQGDVPTNALVFWKSLLRKKLPPHCLRSVRFTVFGLGDSSYPKFNWAARKLHRRLSQLGASEFFPSGEGDERHDDGIDSIFVPWYQELRAALLKSYPLPASVPPIPDDVVLPPRILVRLAPDDPHASPSTKDVAEGRVSRPGTADEQGGRRAGAEEGRPGDRNQSLDGAGLADRERPAAERAGEGVPNVPPADLLPIPHAYTAQLLENRRITPADHWQDVRQLTLRLAPRGDDGPRSIPDLTPGSTLILYPKNDPRDVQAILDLLGWGDLADRPLEWVPYVGATGASRASLRSRFAGTSRIHAPQGATLRFLFTHVVDFHAVPKRSFLREITPFATNPLETERLREFALPENTQEFYDYTFRPKRTILELLQDFPSLRLPLERVLDVFPLIRGREFSIANGGASLRREGEHARVVELLAALVQYRTIIRKPRQGLCSRYLRHLPAGTLLRVGVKVPPSGPPCDEPSLQRPLVAVATGTGIAPIRSLIQERAYLAAAAAAAASSASSSPSSLRAEEEPPRTLLFFGCRNEKADYYFRDQWEATPGMRVVPAFSRDPSPPSAEPGGPVATTTTTTTTTSSSSSPAAAAAADYDRGKNYVQHQIRRHAAEVADLLLRRRALVCLCGNSGRMPVSVHAALLDAMVLGGLVGDRAEAEEAWRGVTFWQETW